MSWLAFIASDYPLEDIENPHIKLLSVNEALESGIAVSELVLNSTDIDRNKPNVILWVDEEENLGEITIRTTDKNSWSSGLPTTLKYCSVLELYYSEERGKRLIAYIRKHLELASILEVVYTWVGNIENEPKVKRNHININDLLLADIEKMFNCNEIDEYRLVITH